MISSKSILIDPDIVLNALDLREGMRAAELGCGGHGHFVFPMAKMVGSKGMIYAVDVLPSALNSIERQARLGGVNQVSYIWSDLEQVGAADIPEKSLHRAAIINTLFQTKDKRSVIEEAKRLLTDDGALIIIDWQTKALPLGPPIDLRLNPADIEGIAKDVGFRLDEKFEPSEHHYGLIFRMR